MDDVPLWTLRELIAEVATQLARNYEAADNGQVRAIPDERSVRYYTSLGLLDRPASMRGRTALYGLRHVAQLVAIKRLQGLGKSLAEIQAVLATVDDDTLSRISGVVLPKATRTREHRASFWKAAPASVPAPVPAPAPAPAAAGSVFATYSIIFSPRVTLNVIADRPPTDADVAALLTAAAPLLAELETRGLGTVHVHVHDHVHDHDSTGDRR